MANIYKSFANGDIVPVRTLVHEAIPITGTIISGTYSDENIKDFSHGRFQAVYDYPYLSSSANHIFDITIGYSSVSGLSGTTSATNQNDKKIQMYNQMAQVLVGHDITGTIMRFDQDGNFADGGTKYNELVFINFDRLLYKDEIKKGSFSMTVGTSSVFTTPFVGTSYEVTDEDAQTDFRVNSPASEYGILKNGSGTSVGLIYYQAGIVALIPTVFGTGSADVAGLNMYQLMASGAMSASADAVRHRIVNVQFNNTTVLQSTYYYCKLSNKEFNYSSNPTYLSGSKIQVKNNQTDTPISYITTVGLYSPDNVLLAAAKVSEPLKKDPTTEKILRVRLDF